jgi:hypothetical protein
LNTFKQSIKRKSVRQQVQKIHRAAQKIASSKEEARRFLISTGVYSGTGQLKPDFRG